MEITKCVGGCLGKGHISILRKSRWLSIDQRHNLSYGLTDNEDYLVGMILRNTSSCKTTKKDEENEAFS